MALVRSASMMSCPENVRIIEYPHAGLRTFERMDPTDLSGQVMRILANALTGRLPLF